MVCSEKEYSETVKRAKLPSRLGIAVPRRGALSIASGVSLVLFVAADETERRERRMVRRATRVFIEDNILPKRLRETVYRASKYYERKGREEKSSHIFVSPS